MTAALKDDGAVQLRQGSLEGGDGRRTPYCRPVTIATDEQRRHIDLRAPKRRKVFPVAVNVSIPIERTTKARVFELVRVHSQDRIR